MIRLSAGLSLATTESNCLGYINVNEKKYLNTEYFLKNLILFCRIEKEILSSINQLKMHEIKN